MTKSGAGLICTVILLGSAPMAGAQGASAPAAPQAIADDGFGALLGASNCIVAGEILVAKGEGARESEETTKAWREILSQLNADGRGEKVLAMAKASYSKMGDTPAGMANVKDLFKLCADKDYRENYIDRFGAPATAKAAKQGGG
jgi:hypothetical protein